MLARCVGVICGILCCFPGMFFSDDIRTPHPCAGGLAPCSCCPCSAAVAAGLLCSRAPGPLCTSTDSASSAPQSSSSSLPPLPSFYPSPPPTPSAGPPQTYPQHLPSAPCAPPLPLSLDSTLVLSFFINPIGEHLVVLVRRTFTGCKKNIEIETGQLNSLCGKTACYASTL